MNKLERLLRGDKATHNGEPIDHVADLRKFAKGDEAMICISVNNGYSWMNNDCTRSDWDDIEFLKPEKSRTIQDGLREGDIISDGKYTRKILGVCGSVYMCSGFDDEDYYDAGYTLKELIDRKYQLICQEQQGEELVELTLEEISQGKGVGVPSHLLRIKE